MKANSSVVGCTLLALVLGAPLLVAQNRRPMDGVLSDADVEMYARALRMADRRIVDTLVVRDGLASSETSVRAATALALAQVSPTNRMDATPILRSLTVFSDPAVVANAMFGLGLVRDSISIPSLNIGVGRNGEVGLAAAWALGEIGEPARETIATLLRTTRGRVQASVSAELLLAAAKVFPLDIEVIEPYLKDRNVTVRWAAAYVVARRRDAQGVAALLRMTRDQPEVRAEVARGLVWFAVRDTLREEAFDALTRLMQDDYVQVRVNAVRSIATFGRIGQRPIRSSTLDRETTVQVAAAEVAGMVFDSDPRTWRELERADTSFAYQRALVTSSVQAGAPMSQVNGWRRSSDWRYRMASVAVWERAADTVAAKAVGLIATYDKDGRIRGAGYALLSAMDPHGIDPIVQDILDASTSDPDLEARESNPNYRRVPTPIDSAHAKRPLAWYDTVVREVVIPALAGRARGATLVTDRGTLSLEMLATQAPLTVYNFLTLAEQGYYDGLRFHRVVPNFVAQDGDPRGDGNGGPGYAIRDELNRSQYRRGAVGMALAGPDTGGSQYFLTLSNQPHLDGRYPLFAKIVSGRAVMDALVQGDAIRRIVVQTQ